MSGPGSSQEIPNLRGNSVTFKVQISDKTGNFIVRKIRHHPSIKNTQIGDASSSIPDTQTTRVSFRSR